MHQAGPPRKSIAPASNLWLLAALAGGNVALSFGPWLVRLADTGPVAAAFWRIALAAPVLLGAAAVLGQRPLTQARGLWGLILIGGIAFAADLGSWHAGIRRTTLANATLFGNAATLIYPIYGFVAMRAWPTRSQALALAIAAAGGALLIGRSAELSSRHLLGDLLCLAAGCLYALYFIAMARARESMQPLPALALSTIASALPLLAATLLLGERLLPGDWRPIVMLALASQVIGQGLMIYAIGNLPPFVVGIALLIQPVVAATIGWIVYDERLGVPEFAGGVLVAIALVLVRRAPRTAVAPAPAPAQGGAR